MTLNPTKPVPTTFRKNHMSYDCGNCHSPCRLWTVGSGDWLGLCGLHGFLSATMVETFFNSSPGVPMYKV